MKPSKAILVISVTYLSIVGTVELIDSAVISLMKDRRRLREYHQLNGTGVYVVEKYEVRTRGETEHVGWQKEMTFSNKKTASKYIKHRQ